jgi:hypothetical protein
VKRDTARCPGRDERGRKKGGRFSLAASATRQVLTPSIRRGEYCILQLTYPSHRACSVTVLFSFTTNQLFFYSIYTVLAAVLRRG